MNQFTTSYTESLTELGSNSLLIFASIFSNSLSKSEYESGSDFNPVFINLEICVFFILYLRSSK